MLVILWLIAAAGLFCWGALTMRRLQEDPAFIALTLGTGLLVMALVAWVLALLTSS